MVAVGGNSARWNFSTPVTSFAGIDPGVFLIDGSPGLSVEGSGADWVQLEHDGSVNPGSFFEAEPPTGIAFLGGGDIAASSGTVS